STPCSPNRGPQEERIAPPPRNLVATNRRDTRAAYSSLTRTILCKATALRVNRFTRLLTLTAHAFLKRRVSLKPPATEPTDESLPELSFPSSLAGLVPDRCHPADRASR